MINGKCKRGGKGGPQSFQKVRPKMWEEVEPGTFRRENCGGYMVFHSNEYRIFPVSTDNFLENLKIALKFCKGNV